MARWVLLLVTGVVLGMCAGYNLDVLFPIVYSDPANYYGRSSYFGFTVILQASADNPEFNWIQVGAPRGNYTGKKHIEPGVVFRCPVAQICWKLPLDFDVGKNFYLNRAWVGGAMDIQSPESGSRSVVCGHHWTSVTLTSKGIIHGKSLLGICYWLNQDFTSRSTNEEVNYMQTLNDARRRHFFFPNGKLAYDWGVGQMGTSVHFPPHTEDEVLMGAPGVRNWQGNVIHCRGGPPVTGGGNQRKRSVEEERLDQFAKCTRPDDVSSEYVEYLSYSGYSVHSGRFYERTNLVYVAGGPRAKNFNGNVFLYNPSWDKSKAIDIVEKGVGSSMGEYYGASLAAGDFNGDSLDDLVVGAPLFTRNLDEGCIYIYYGNSKGTIIQGQVHAIKIVGKVPGGRFGTAVTALGDLNQDGYHDLAVGAPYEDDNRGAIYIFNGGRDGLELEYSQRVTAGDVSPHLRGFGISIARPADIDHNLYSDIAVGAYISGHAVILRGRPIISLSHSLDIKEQQVDRNATKFTLKTCSFYTGSNVPTQLAIARTLVLDEAFKRAKIRDKGYKVNKQSYTKTVQLSSGVEQCEEVVVHIQKESANLTDPIEIQVFQDLEKKDPPYGEVIWVNTTTTTQAKDRFCKECPIVSRRSSNMDNTLVVKFDLNCGPDNLCDSHMTLGCHFLALSDENTYKLGSNKNLLLLQMTVTNEGELAYSPSLKVTIPSPVNLFRIPINCQIDINITDTTVLCDLENPLAAGVKNSQTLELDMSSVKWQTGSLQFAVTVNTQSNNLNAENSSQVLPLAVVSEAMLTMAGKAINDTYSYVSLLHNHTEKTIYFYHVYQVQKVGASPVEEALIEVFVPFSMLDEEKSNKVQFLGMYEPEGKLNDVDIKCGSDFPMIGGAYLVDKDNRDNSQFSDDIGAEAGDGVGGVEQESLVQGSHDRRAKREASLEGAVDRVAENLPSNRTLFLNCSVPGVTCLRVWCRAGRFVGSVVARLKIRMVLDIGVLEPLLGPKDIIFLSSLGSATIEEDLPGKKTARALAATTFLGSIPDQVVNDWVIPLAIAIGLLLLFLLIMLLVKVGFFARKKKAELQALINAEAEAENTASPQEPEQKQEMIEKEPDEMFEFE